MVKTRFLVFSFLLSSILRDCISSPSPSIENQCRNAFPKLYACADYSSGKAAVVTAACCKSVTEIRKDKPVCLCYVIQQAHDGNAQLKSLGVQVSRLLQLQSACKLANSKPSDCPKALNILPGSPDYAFFTNSSAANSNSSAGATASPETSSNSTTGMGTGTGTTPTPASTGSAQRHPIFKAVIVAIAIVIVFFSAVSF